LIYYFFYNQDLAGQRINEEIAEIDIGYIA